jgi:hypothetical protein
MTITGSMRSLPRNSMLTYLNMAIDDHESAINRFESYSNGDVDEALKVWAMGLIPDMRIHLQKIKDLKQTISNPEAVK